MRLRVVSLVAGLAACSDGTAPPTGERYRLTALGVPAAATAGTRLQFHILVEDLGGRPVAGVPLSLEPSAGGDAVAYDPGMTREDGRLHVGWWLGHPPGIQRLRARAGTDSLEVTIETTVFSLERIKAGGEAACGTRGTELWCFGYLAPSVAPSPFEAPPLQLFPGLVVADFTIGSRGACVLDPDGTPHCLVFDVNLSRALVTPIIGAPPLDSLTGGSAGISHGFFCGLARGDKSTWCWDVRGPDRTWSPARQVTGAPAFMQVGAGQQFGCGRTAQGAVWCWGDGERGQLGNGSSTSSATPVQVTSPVTFMALAVGLSFACGVNSMGHVYCWGSVLRGGDLANTPTLIPGLLARKITTGTHDLVVTQDAEFVVWRPTNPTVYPRTYRGGEIAELVTGSLTTCMRSPEDYAYCYYAHGGGGVPLPPAE